MTWRALGFALVAATAIGAYWAGRAESRGVITLHNAKLKCDVVRGIEARRDDERSTTGGVRNSIVGPNSAYVRVDVPGGLDLSKAPVILLTCHSTEWSYPSVGGAASVLHDGRVAPYATLRRVDANGFFCIVNWPNQTGQPHRGPGKGTPNSAPPKIDLHYLIVE